MLRALHSLHGLHGLGGHRVLLAPLIDESARPFGNRLFHSLHGLQLWRFNAVLELGVEDVDRLLFVRQQVLIRVRPPVNPRVALEDCLPKEHLGFVGRPGHLEERSAGSLKNLLALVDRLCPHLLTSFRELCDWMLLGHIESPGTERLREKQRRSH